MAILEPLDDVVAWKPTEVPEIIAGGLLPFSGKLILAGAEGSFKTMLSLYSSFMISSGQPLFGIIKTAPVPVAMIQCELSKSFFQKRILKLLSANTPHGKMYFATELFLKLDKPAGLAGIASEIKKEGIKLLIIDPLYKVTTNLTDELHLRSFLDNLDNLCWNFHCATWIVHHTRKHHLAGAEIIDLGSEELFGISLLADWADTIIRVKRDEDILHLDFPKVRNAEALMPPMDLKFNSRTLCFDVVY